MGRMKDIVIEIENCSCDEVVYNPQELAVESVVTLVLVVASVSLIILIAAMLS
jgi:hypothetical protein